MQKRPENSINENENDNKIDVRIKLCGHAPAPKYATEGSAAVDLCADIDAPYTINPGERHMFKTGVAISTGRRDCVAIVAARSGLGCRHGLTLANGIGVIDSDYRGEISVTLINTGDRMYTVSPLERIAQLFFVPVWAAVFTETDALDETSRGEGGFGSTGKQ